MCYVLRFFVLNDFVYVQRVIEVDANVTKLYRAQNDIAVHDSFFFFMFINGL